MKVLHAQPGMVVPWLVSHMMTWGDIWWVAGACQCFILLMPGGSAYAWGGWGDPPQGGHDAGWWYTQWFSGLQLAVPTVTFWTQTAYPNSQTVPWFLVPHVASFELSGTVGLPVDSRARSTGCSWIGPHTQTHKLLFWKLCKFGLFLLVLATSRTINCLVFPRLRPQQLRHLCFANLVYLPTTWVEFEWRLITALELVEVLFPMCTCFAGLFQWFTPKDWMAFDCCWARPGLSNKVGLAPAQGFVYCCQHEAFDVLGKSLCLSYTCRRKHDCSWGPCLKCWFRR